MSTSASGSQPSQYKEDRFSNTPSSTLKNKYSKLNANYELKCVKCNGCMLSNNHDLCVLDFINNVSARDKSRSVKKNSKRKVWKPTGKVFYNMDRLETSDNKTPKPVITFVYSRKPRKSKTSVPVNNYKVVQIVLWYLDSGCSKHMTGDRSQLTNFVSKFLGTVKFGNDHVAKIMGYEILDGFAFRQHTCYIRNLEGVDLLTGSRGDNLYTLSLGDMMASSPIVFLSKASKNQVLVMHRRLSSFELWSYLSSCSDMSCSRFLKLKLIRTFVVLHVL
ncbi:hypothetical protein Tco_0421050 [Tanacetum coccineum]